MSGRRITLDNPEFAGRLRITNRPTSYTRRPVATSRRIVVSEFVTVKQQPSVPAQTATKQICPIQNKQAFIPESPITDSRPYLRKTSRPPISKTPQHTNVRPPVKPEDKTKKEFTQKHVKSKNNKLLMSMAVFLFVAGIGVTIWQIKTNKRVADQVQGVASAQSNSESGLEGLDESESTSQDSYLVPADNPRLLKIPKISINAKVRKMGLMANGQLRSPPNIFDTGWYENSAKPTDLGGAILIDGHVHGPTKPGVFKNLSKLVPGDKVQIETGAKKIITFSVVKTRSFDANNVDMNSTLVSVDSAKLGLNIITCSGDIDDSGSHYKERLVVYTVKD